MADAIDVLVLGGGPAGVTAALRARELGARVMLLERDTLGGACTNDGCVPTRVLAHAARLVREARQYADYGLIGEPPTVGFSRVLAGARATVERIHAKKRIHHHLEEMGVAVFTRTGEAHFTDAHTLVCANGETFQAEKIIIAVGGHARKLPFPGADYALTHSDVWRMTHLPRSMAIVGGAATAASLPRSSPRLARRFMCWRLGRVC
jgi:pyruvate/2-oxoglutarate dehydrogenase complex dihydrolipoamide dehydrogenase (E3) component